MSVSTKVEELGAGAEEEAEEDNVPEMTVEAATEELGGFVYKVRLLFTTTHHQELVSPEERKAMLKRIDEVKAFADGLEDEAAADELHTQAETILAILHGNEYLRNGKAQSLEACLAHGDACGYEALKEEPWRAQLVAKAAKCNYPQAVSAVDKNPDLRAAIAAAPKINLRWSTMPEGFVPPTRPS